MQSELLPPEKASDTLTISNIVAPGKLDDKMIFGKIDV